MVTVKFRKNPSFNSNSHKCSLGVIGYTGHIFGVYRKHQEFHQVCFQAFHSKMSSYWIHQTVFVEVALGALFTIRFRLR